MFLSNSTGEDLGKGLGRGKILCRGRSRRWVMREGTTVSKSTGADPVFGEGG